MRTKVTFIVGFATGYVLGSRAGRARYEQIRSAARAFAANPAVQSTASSLQQQAGGALATVKDRATDTLGEKLGDKKPAWLGGGSWAGHPGTTQHTTTGATPGPHGYAGGPAPRGAGDRWLGCGGSTVRRPASSG